MSKTLDPRDDLPSNQMDSEEEREIIQCPICDTPFLERKVVILHVSSSTDDEHRYRDLDGDLNVVSTEVESPRTADW